MEWLEIISAEAAGSKETKKIVEQCNAINVPQILEDLPQTAAL